MLTASKIERIFDLAVELGFTEQDFAYLAVSCADQSGCTRAESAKVAEICRVDWPNGLVEEGK